MFDSSRNTWNVQYGVRIAGCKTECNHDALQQKTYEI